MKFDYKAIAGDHKRPFIPITLRNPKNDKSVECYALVDSGSERNLFAPVIGEIIGIDIEHGVQHPIAGIVAGERRSFFDHKIEMIVGGWRFATTVGFMPNLSSQAGQGVVGQNGFFEHFNFVKFDKRKNMVELGNFVR